MKTLSELRSWVLSAPDEGVRGLEIADKYLQMRDRMQSALTKALALKLIPDTPDDKSRYLRVLALEWGARRTQTLKAERAAAKGKLSLDHQADILAAIWAGIDAQIANGELPKP